ncbi:hypothetical protein CO154_01560 [Candidatus Pacearchaeota archaeon CG_4_9_14_3_um_filter_31_7]|nr:MAG: hypothetical protein AUJ10_01945 [Candidatus Pacearchaeota archaeon CG1_02_31_27]PIN92569.1 MAG: hypothetical protein COU55_00055 [Candidatus Pacearchaeota archaeon CG10_big_fil_rev_8_21_14_0_10_31_59]PIZ80878.1 MAG: hypothetical protein COX99_01395 [Candidatus Pacearchaeota archaeon CG_4_10_14_0_2_um_filter_31_10]PJA70699.1 MAG: hypothetical protein CO154_01560 [Candidatus Pacearchaeota archaeon CG_4_9_14_3_um_filter_31_7]
MASVESRVLRMPGFEETAERVLKNSFPVPVENYSPAGKYQFTLEYLGGVGIIDKGIDKGKKVVSFNFIPENFPEDRRYNKTRRLLRELQSTIGRFGNRVSLGIDEREYKDGIDGIVKLTDKFIGEFRKVYSGAK